MKSALYIILGTIFAVINFYWLPEPIISMNVVECIIGVLLIVVCYECSRVTR